MHIPELVDLRDRLGHFEGSLDECHFTWESQLHRESITLAEETVSSPGLDGAVGLGTLR